MYGEPIQHVGESLLGESLLENKVQQKSQEFDAPASQFERMVISMDQNKAVTLIPHFDFINPDTFTNVVKQRVSFFLELLEVIPKLKLEPSTRVLILEHFKTQVQVFFQPRECE